MSKRRGGELSSSQSQKRCLDKSDYDTVKTELLKRFGYVKYRNDQRKYSVTERERYEKSAPLPVEPRADGPVGSAKEGQRPEDNKIAVGSDSPVAMLPVESAFSQVESPAHATLQQVKRRHDRDCAISSRHVRAQSHDEKEKKGKTQTKLFAAQDGSLKLVSGQCVESLVLRDLSCFTERQLDDVEQQLKLTDEVLVSLMFGDGATQLRDASDRKTLASDTKPTTVEVSGMGLSTSCSSGREFYLIPMNSKQGSFYEWSRRLVFELMRSQTRKVCYDCQEMIRALVTHYAYATKEVCTDWLLLDPGVAGWLLDADHPPQSFSEMLARFTNFKQTPARGSHSSSQFCSDLSLLGRLMFILYQKLESCGLWPLFLNLEMRLCPMLAAMEINGICVDVEEFSALSEMLKGEVNEIERKAHDVVGRPVSLNSAKQLRELLFDELKLDEKLSGKSVIKTTTLNEKSTSEAVLMQLKELHPLPELILQYRHVVKVKSTYFDGILSHISEGVVHTHWQQTAAATGRLSSANPNIQTIPRLPVTVQGKNLVFPRQPFQSQPNCSFLTADFQSIELRLLAHFSSDSNLLCVINTQQATHDVFTRLASEWLDMFVDEVSSGDRNKAKRVAYAVIYGVGPDKLSDMLGVPLDQAKHFITSFLAKFPGIQRFTQQCICDCRTKGHVSTIFRRRRLIPHIYSDNYRLRNQAARQAVNFVVQGSAADLCKAAMVQTVHALAKAGINANLLVQIHDELLFEVKDKDLKQASEIVRTVMESADGLCGGMVQLKVPLGVTLSYGKKWHNLAPVTEF